MEKVRGEFMYSIFSTGMVLNLLFLVIFMFGVFSIVKSIKEGNVYLKEIITKLNKN